MSSSVNKVILIGNLTKDPEVKSFDGDRKACRFSVATNRTWKDKDGEKKEEVEFHNVTAWGKLAEICGDYLHKGKKVYIEGRLRTRTYEKDGVKHYATEIVADDMKMLTPKGEGGERSSRREEAPTNDDINPDDIPF
jgi:single-strand DNA-binding protein